MLFRSRPPPPAPGKPPPHPRVPRDHVLEYPEDTDEEPGDKVNASYALVFGVDEKKMEADDRLEHEEIVLGAGEGGRAAGGAVLLGWEAALFAEFRLASVLWTCFSIAKFKGHGLCHGD